MYLGFNNVIELLEQPLNYIPFLLSKIINVLPWLVWLSGSGIILQTERLPVGFLVRAHAWVVGQVPGWGHERGNQLMFLSLSFSLPLSKNE